MRVKFRSQCLSGIVLFIVFTTGWSLRAQKPSTPASAPPGSITPSIEREFFKNILRDQKKIWTAPLHLDRSDAKWAIPGGIGLMALVTTDRITGDEMREFDPQLTPSRVVSYAGSAYGLGAGAAAFYFLGRDKNDQRMRETGVLSAEAFLNSVIVGGALKGISQRARPLDGRERSEFFEGGSSFPSGHSIQAWSVATVIANEYHDKPAVRIAAYGIASAVSVARFTGQKHYLSDVLVGSALGFGIGHYVYHAHHQGKTDSPADNESATDLRWPLIEPHFNREAHQYGVAVKWSF